LLCNFENCKLVHNGADFEILQGCRFIGGISVGSDNPEISRSVAFLSRMGFLKEPITSPDGETITSVFRPNRADSGGA
jgi:hypothetical protein